MITVTTTEQFHKVNIILELENGNQIEIIEIDEDSFIMNNLTNDCTGFLVEDGNKKSRRKIFDDTICITPEG